ncbi:glycerate kinase [Streptomyces jumonjinensis]|uniref:Glycerate kinase n=1 Tax=Streptomyces jumonjinensis TaxID=1945 RepID=A0A646KEB0_STRJU|nr:glycerate kinase [Streptomyces jumonjinensis]
MGPTLPGGPGSVRVVIAPDSFKGSLTATAVCAAIETGVRRALPDADVVRVPMADGGEGTLDCILGAVGGDEIALTVAGPLGQPVRARYGLSPDGRSAVVELASASGLPLLAGATDPLRADTAGTGELIADAIGRGARDVLVCIGGSASTDGGAGLLRALGVRFEDAGGEELPPGGAGLADLARVEMSGVAEAVRETRFRIACDVTNPLVGPEGAAAVFGPQKGASPDQVRLLDAALTRFGDVLAERFGVRVHDLPGAGAAGGTCGGMVAVLGAEPVRGCELVADTVGLPAALAGADLVITGEGRVDRQSAGGKVVSLVARLAGDRGVPAVALAGEVVLPIDELYALGLTAAFSIADGPRTLAAMTESAAPLLAAAAEQAVRLRSA